MRVSQTYLIMIMMALTFLLLHSVSEPKESVEQHRGADISEYDFEKKEEEVLDIFEKKMRYYLGVPYSDFESSEKSCRYAAKGKNADGDMYYCYIINMDYEKKNGRAQTVKHYLEARGYIVNGKVYFPYINLDGEIVKLDGSQEDWILGAL